MTDPAELRLTWHTDIRARGRLEQRLFGKRILFTNRDDWPVADVVAAYRSQSEVESGFRQLKDPHVVSFSPMHHWTDSKIRVHVFYCVLALAIAHLMRREAANAGLHLSVRELLNTLAGIARNRPALPRRRQRPPPRPTHAHRHGPHPATPRRPVRHPPLRTHPLTPPGLGNTARPARTRLHQRKPAKIELWGKLRLGLAQGRSLSERASTGVPLYTVLLALYLAAFLAVTRHDVALPPRATLTSVGLGLLAAVLFAAAVPVLPPGLTSLAFLLIGAAVVGAARLAGPAESRFLAGLLTTVTACQALFYAAAVLYQYGPDAWMPYAGPGPLRRWPSWNRTGPRQSTRTSAHSSSVRWPRASWSASC